MKHILLVTSKSPFISSDFDGGSVLVSQLCRFLPKFASLDILFLRKWEKKFKNLQGVNEYQFFKPLSNENCRFTNRIINAKKTVSLINKVHARYDKIFIIHISNCFGIDDTPPELKSKLVLFPMFTGDSYIRSGEVVPDLYLLEEKKALQCIPCISTPSLAESNQLQFFYGVNSEKILLHPRGIDLDIYYQCQRQAPNYNKEINILYIASIKCQKNQIDTILIVEELKKRGLKPIIHIVGGISCKLYYQQVQDLIISRGQKNNFIFYNTVMPNKILQIAKNCHYGISVSKWETFGKGVFEGMATGLPSFAYESINCLWEYLDRDSGIKAISCSPKAMANAIETTVKNPSCYQILSEKAVQEVQHLNLNFLIKNMIIDLVQ